MNIRWFYSRTVRHATAMRKHVWRLLRAQTDILPPQAVEGVSAALAGITGSLKLGASKDELEKQMNSLEAAANKWLKPYPHPAWRENIEVALVALVIAIGIRTFFVQPFKIPTASMQPTLFGVTPELFSGNQPDLKIPGRLERFFDYWIHGESYFHIAAPEDGRLERVDPPTFFKAKLSLFNLQQKYLFSGKWHTVWFPPDNLFERAGYQVNPYTREVGNSPEFKRGEDVVRIKTIAGDHLFVDRLSYNFRRPERGEIIVFETHGVPGTTLDTYYIKRLCGLGGETLALKRDFDVLNVTSLDKLTIGAGHLVVDGSELSAGTPGFENIYSANVRNLSTTPYQPNQYYGHSLMWRLSPNEEFQVRPRHYFVMGDNTMNSSDSRYWGDFPQEKVMGKSFFVYWPISKRFGLGYH